MLVVLLKLCSFCDLPMVVSVTSKKMGHLRSFFHLSPYPLQFLFQLFDNVLTPTGLGVLSYLKGL